jgi:hypothetical protein
MSLRQTVLLVALLNLAYFGVEFGVAIAIGSVSLFADSVDFREDASINLLLAAGLGWSAQNRARLGMVLAAVILVPVAATLWTAWQKFAAPVPPHPVPLTLTGAGAFLVSACPLPPSQRQPNPRRLSVGPKRRAGQCGYRRRRLGDRRHPVGLAGPDRRTRDCGSQRRCGAPGHERGQGGEEGGASLSSYHGLAKMALGPLNVVLLACLRRVWRPFL